MMTWIFCGMIVLSVVFGIMNGNMAQVSSAALNDSVKAVELMIKLLGGICLWSGVLRVADESGLTKNLSRLFSPLLKLLFKDMDPDSPAAKAISMNIAANMLGLGNAATPLGVSAMKEMANNAPISHAATNNMVTFVVLNTASIQILPTTTAMMRMTAGSSFPLDILHCVWLTSIISVAFGVLMSFMLGKLWRYA